MNRRAAIPLATALLFACRETHESRARIDAPGKGWVVAVDPTAAEVGASILRRGGNAADAAVATALALAVTWPAAGNLGGGGFVLLHWMEGPSATDHFLDFRETAPALANETMYVDDGGHIAAERAKTGALAVGVPGTVAGLEALRLRFGTMTFRDLVEPARILAHDGFVVRPSLAKSVARARADLARFPETARVYLRSDGSAPEPGERWRLPDLARTLDTLAVEGPGAFSRGPLASAIVAAVRERGGILTEGDLSSYEPRWREPVRGTYRGHTVVSAPPPSSGGTVVVETLNVLEGFDLASAPRDDPRTLHLLIEAARIAYRDRALWLGDPDFGFPPPDWLIAKPYAGEARAGIRLDRATRSVDLARGLEIATEAPESNETTHFTVSDARGNVACLTFTLNDSFGSKLVAGRTGVLLNDEMSDFNLKPGFTSSTGRIGTAPNGIAPGKRMLSSMSPTLVLDGADVLLALGSPGGRAIPNSVLQVLMNVVDFGMTPREAIDHGRLHHAWLPDRVDLEPGYLDARARAALSALGHQLRDASDPQGDVHAIVRHGGRLVGVADRRIDGFAASP